ncbi:32592_t:CDS:2, partial [Gigaspora margarita]
MSLNLIFVFTLLTTLFTANATQFTSCLGNYVANIQMTPDPPVTGNSITLNINAIVDKDIGDNGKINSSLPTLYQIQITLTRQDNLIAYCAE